MAGTVPRARAIRGLYAITPDHDDTELLVHQVQAAIRGGVRLLQYRNKAAGVGLRRSQALALLAACRSGGAALIVNDDPELAAELSADGVHIGDQDGGTALVRQRLGPGPLLGVSCYDSLERARAASADGADYVAFGAAFPSTTKPAAVRATPALLRAAKASLDLPVVAIGGITLANLAEVVAAGVDAIAVISDLFGAADIEGRAAALVRRFAELSALRRRTATGA